MTDAEGLHTPTLVANCVLNGFLSYTAIVLNIITIHALRKTSSLPTTLKTLLLSLSISDLGVGLLVQPLYVAFLTMEITKNSKNTDNIFAYRAVVKAYAIPNRLFVVSSFFGVFEITVDRFLVIHLHLRYQKLVTHKRVVAVVISFWVFSVIACFWYESISVLSVMSVVCIISYRIALLQDIRSRKTPHKPDSPSANTWTSSSEWRHGKCRKAEKNCCCYILRVYLVFSLLFANSLCWPRHDDPW